MAYQIYAVNHHQVEVSAVTPLATVLGAAWRETPVPSRLDVRWRTVFGYSSLASRVINYLTALSRRQAYTTLGALTDALVARYTATQHFGKGIGVSGTAYLLTALEITPPAPPVTTPTPSAIRRAAARQLRVVAASIQEQVTPDNLTALRHIHHTLSELCAAVP